MYHYGQTLREWIAEKEKEEAKKQERELEKLYEEARRLFDAI